MTIRSWRSCSDCGTPLPAEEGVGSSEGLCQACRGVCDRCGRPLEPISHPTYKMVPSSLYHPFVPTTYKGVIAGSVTTKGCPHCIREQRVGSATPPPEEDASPGGTSVPEGTWFTRLRVQVSGWSGVLAGLITLSVLLASPETIGLDDSGAGGAGSTVLHLLVAVLATAASALLVAAMAHYLLTVMALPFRRRPAGSGRSPKED